MNTQTINAFWAAMPPEMKLILGVFVGATLHFLRNRAVPVAQGLTGAVTAAIAGYVLTFAVCALKKWDLGDWWFLGVLFTFMANFFLGGMETVGKQIQDSPVKFIIESFLDVYDAVKSRFSKPK